jgi:hypothetical protein
MDRPYDFRTLVSLRAKKGELAALEALDADRLVQPLLLVDHQDGSSVGRLLDRVEAAVRGLWALDRTTMLDTSAGLLERLTGRLSAPTTLLDEDAVPFVPVVGTTADDRVIALANQLSGQLGYGCALRVRLPATHELVGMVLDRLSIEPARLDVIIDAGYIAGLDPQLVDDVLDVVDSIAPYGDFRSTTVLSGSVPKSLSQVHLWEQPRFEETLWESIRSESPTAVRFGDYGAVHPVSSSDPWRSKHISLKYTCSDHWLYLREPIVDSDAENARARAVQLVSHELVNSGSFSGPEFSWGDRQIASAAGGTGRGLGDLSKPVAFATSHHLAYLSEFTAA